MRLPQRLIKIGFFLLYNHLAFTYDFIAWIVSLGQWADWRRSALSHLQPGRTLELAYGTGGLYVDMVKSGLQPIGIDLSPFMARLTARKLRHAQLPGAIIRCQAQALPFPTGTFANAVATFPTNYIFEPETLAEVRRVLADQPDRPGQLVVVVQGRLRGSGIVNRFIDWLYQITGQHETIVEEPLKRFKEAGFAANWEIGRYRQAAATLIVAPKIGQDQPVADQM
jgi:ubiquinone/menaquinone biosynthesis C-methylase UbiE